MPNGKGKMLNTYVNTKDNIEKQKERGKHDTVKHDTVQFEQSANY